MLPLVATALALALTGLVQLALTGDEDAPAGPAGPAGAGTAKQPKPSGAARARLDLSELPIARAPFCNVLGEDAVELALGGEVTDTAHYDNGDEVEITPGYTDISHEFNCTFRGETATARAWVFARPVGRPEATALVQAATEQAGCTTPEAIEFGTPGVTTVCEDDEQDRARVRMQGLFGDSWLTCELTLPGQQKAAAPRRTEEWCIDVATSLGARP